MITKEIYLVGGCSGVGKTSLLTPDILDGKKRIHTGDISRSLTGASLYEISEDIVREIGKNEVVLLDTHYAAVNGKTGFSIFYQGIEDDHLRILSQIPKKRFVLVEADPFDVLKRRLTDAKRRSKDYDQVVRELSENREKFFHYLKLTGAEGHIVRNDKLEIARKRLSELLI